MKLNIWMFHIAIWLTTSKKCIKLRAARTARLLFLIQPILLLFSGAIVAVAVNLGSLSTRRFRATDGKRKSAVFLFNMSSHYYIYIVKSLLASRECVRDHCIGMRNVHCRFPSVTQKRRLLKHSSRFADDGRGKH